MTETPEPDVDAPDVDDAVDLDDDGTDATPAEEAANDAEYRDTGDAGDELPVTPDDETVVVNTDENVLVERLRDEHDGDEQSNR